MRRALAIARLTFAEGVRMRIVLVFLILLVFLVLRMPFALRGDDTLTGRLQNFLAYSLGALSLLLSLATVFFSCATLTNEIKERSLHLVVTKPVTRFQILVGKWLGVMLLNLLIVALCGGAIYGLAYFIQSRPEQFERDRLQVRDVVWTARLAARPTVPQEEIVQEAARNVQERIDRGELEPSQQKEALAARAQEVMNQWRNIEPGGYRVYRFEGLTPPETQDTVIQVRYQARGLPIPPGEMLTIMWVIHDPETGAPLAQRQTRDRSSETHEFLVRAEAAVRNGVLDLGVYNVYPPETPISIFFEGDNSLQVLYKVGGFEGNFLRALLIIVFQLALLSALGVFFGVFVSFPVACLCTGAFFLIALTFPYLMEAMGTNIQALGEFDPYGPLGPYVRRLLVPILQVAVPDFAHFSGVSYVVDGLAIPDGLMVRCAARTVLYGGALLLLPGWLIFRRREIAEVIV